MEKGTSTPVHHEPVVVERVVVHPLVLLSVVDHFNRMGKIGSHKRVVGILLGSWSSKGVLDVSNSFAGKYVIDK
jgi:26S proteasome regulatory subunit N8